MSIQIKLKNSVVQDSTPSTSDLPAVGEIALNANINSIGGFMRASNNTIVKIFGPGSLTTPSVMKKHPDRKLIDTEYVAELILWLINQPEYVNINEISVDPIQAGDYARER